MKRQKVIELDRVETKGFNIDWENVLVDEEVPELEINGSDDKTPPPEPTLSSDDSSLCLRFLKDSELDDQLKRQRTLLSAFSEKLPDKGHRIRTKIGNLEYEKQRRMFCRTKPVKAFVEHEAETNGEPENDDGSAKGDSCAEKLPYEKVDKLTEKNEAGGKESEGDGADDEMCALQDVLETTTMFQNLSKHAQKLMLQKLKTLGGKERKELSDEWKALLVQELLLMSKKQTFAAKLAKAASHN